MAPKAVPDLIEPTSIEAVAPITAPFVPKKLEPKIIEDVPITLDDQPRTLRMDFRAMKLIEKKTGLIMWRDKAWEFDSLTPDTLSEIICACLQHESPGITTEEIDAFPGMSLSNFNYLTMTLTDLWGTTMPAADPVDDTDPNEKETPATV